MAGTQATAHVKSKLVTLLASLPPGRLTTYSALASYLGSLPAHVATILATLDDAERADVAWHRVVHDGGAIGRHPRRDAHIALLRAEGLAVSPVGIVQDLAAHLVADLASPSQGSKASAEGASPHAAGPNRSRGRIDRPKSTL